MYGSNVYLSLSKGWLSAPFVYSVSESIQCSPSWRMTFSVQHGKLKKLFHVSGSTGESSPVVTIWLLEPSCSDSIGCWGCSQLPDVSGLPLACCATVGNPTDREKFQYSDPTFPDSSLFSSSELLDCLHPRRFQDGDPSLTQHHILGLSLLASSGLYLDSPNAAAPPQQRTGSQSWLVPCCKCVSMRFKYSGQMRVYAGCKRWLEGTRLKWVGGWVGVWVG